MLLKKDLQGKYRPALYAVKPVDFPGLVPKLTVKPGDKVQAGLPLFIDKLHPEIKFTSPVSGTVVSVDRGDRRKLLEVVVERSGNEFVEFGKTDPSKNSREKIKEHLTCLRTMAFHQAATISYYCPS